MRLATLAAVSGVALASQAFAGFTFSHTTTTSGGRSAVNIFAFNDGLNGSGTNLTGVALRYQGSAVRFVVNDTDEDGELDTVDFNARVAGFSWIGLAAGTNTTYVGVSPGGSGVQPNPYVSTTSFQADFADLTGGRPASTGAGAQFARFISATGTAAPTGRIFGQIGGNTGSPFNFEYSFGGPTNVAPVFGTASASGTDVALAAGATNAAATVVVDFGDLFGSRAFTVSIPLTDDAALAGSGLSVTGSVAGLSDLTSAIVGGNVVLTGTLSRTVIGTLEPAGTLTVTYTDAGSLSDSYAVTFNAIPEPATLALVAGAGLLALRRRA